MVSITARLDLSYVCAMHHCEGSDCTMDKIHLHVILQKDRLHLIISTRHVIVLLCLFGITSSVADGSIKVVAAVVTHIRELISH